MRILTNSPFESKGLISIIEAEDHAPQIIVFCIPMDKNEARRIQNTFDFEEYFSRGISTKIKDQENTNTIYLDYKSPSKNEPEDDSFPKFVASIKGHSIDFHLSPLNFDLNSKQRLNIEYFYSGKYLRNDLYDKKLILLEPNWQQLDELFLKETIVFTDWS
jgi:hypothetical protein